MSKALTGKSKVYYMIKKLSRTLLIICMSFVIFAVGILGWIIIVYKGDKTESELTHQQDFISNRALDKSNSIQIMSPDLDFNDLKIVRSDKQKNIEIGTPPCVAQERRIQKLVNGSKACISNNDCIRVPSPPFHDAVNRNNIRRIKEELIEYYSFCRSGLAELEYYFIPRCSSGRCKLAPGPAE